VPEGHLTRRQETTVSAHLGTTAAAAAAAAGLLVALGSPALAGQPGLGTGGAPAPAPAPVPTAACVPLTATTDADVVTTGTPVTGTVTVGNCSPLAASLLVRVSVASVADPGAQIAPCPDGPSVGALVALAPSASRTLVQTASAPSCPGAYQVTVSSSLLTGQVVASQVLDLTVVAPATA
jgi:hypothetical protein